MCLFVHLLFNVVSSVIIIDIAVVMPVHCGIHQTNPTVPATAQFLQC